MPRRRHSAEGRSTIPAEDRGSDVLSAGTRIVSDALGRRDGLSGRLVTEIFGSCRQSAKDMKAEVRASLASFRPGRRRFEIRV